jgi:hypothetical protein
MTTGLIISKRISPDEEYSEFSIQAGDEVIYGVGWVSFDHERDVASDGQGIYFLSLLVSNTRYGNNICGLAITTSE